MTRLIDFLIRFQRSEDGNPTVQFAVMFPVLFAFLASSFELGALTLRNTYLERATDLTVRELRLGTGSAPQHDEIRARICARAPVISDCSTKLMVEMVQLDPRAGAGLPSFGSCTNQSEEVEPVRHFENGQENDLMLLRVCALVDPVFPTSTLAEALEKDDQGQYALVARAAFVQEPR